MPEPCSLASHGESFSTIIIAKPNACNLPATGTDQHARRRRAAGGMLQGRRAPTTTKSLRAGGTVAAVRRAVLAETAVPPLLLLSTIKHATGHILDDTTAAGMQRKRARPLTHAVFRWGAPPEHGPVIAAALQWHPTGSFTWCCPASPHVPRARTAALRLQYARRNGQSRRGRHSINI